jgi:hypothetical protein
MFTSCNFLNIDDYIDEQMKYDSIFKSRKYIEAYLWDAASQFPDEGAIFGGGSMYTPGPLATDEAFTLFGTGEYQGMAYVQGEITAENLGVFGTRWKKYYQIIRQCNIIFARIDEVHDWETNKERRDILAYNRFIRAYAYYNLLLNWGPIAIVYDEVANNNAEAIYYDRPRDLYDECIEYICAEFEEAAKDLPERQYSIMDYGRPTRGAAYALVARLRLMHASPMYNGGQIARSYFGNWKRTIDDRHYLAQTPDPKRWAVAAAAAKRVMNLTVGGTLAYKLHYVERNDFTAPLPTNVADPDYHNEFPDGAGGIDPLRSYSELFNGEAVGYSTQEFIWSTHSPALRDYTQRSFPSKDGGANGLCVTQKIIDAYEMADGRLRTNSSAEYPYTEIGFTDRDTILSMDYELKAGVSNMYVNREMRFYASIGFSECHWPCLSTTDLTHKYLTVTYYVDSENGRGGSQSATNYPITGYVIKKFIHPNDAWTGTNAIRVNKTFPIIRYAEILLSYAEALNALDGSYTVEMDGQSQTFTRDVAEIKKAINQIRYRSGLPGLTDTELADPAYVLSKIKKERMVEFLFENRRYFDVRRWGDYEASESEAVTGMNTIASKDSYYQRVTPNSARIAGRMVNRRMIFLPIPSLELKRVPSFDQNPGW